MTSKNPTAPYQQPLPQRQSMLSKFGEIHTSPHSPRRAPDFIIGEPVDPYLLRWWMIPRNDFGNHYRHLIVKDDDDRALHDHPWDSVSVVLSGTLCEILPGGDSRILEVGQPYFRKATDAHRLIVVEGPVWTDFFTGPKVRDWGFHCEQGWVHWEDFTARDNPGALGRGCGETHRGDRVAVFGEADRPDAAQSAEINQNPDTSFYKNALGEPWDQNDGGPS